MSVDGGGGVGVERPIGGSVELSDELFLGNFAPIWPQLHPSIDINSSNIQTVLTFPNGEQVWWKK